MSAFLRSVCLAVAGWSVVTACSGSGDLPNSDAPVTGAEVPALAGFDRAMIELIARYDVPGGALAVVRDGVLVLARGYGWADVDAREPVEPDALFRVASASKPITAAAILTLVEDGVVDLDTPAFRTLRVRPSDERKPDPRLADVTVRHLLHHGGGWDRRLSFDPMIEQDRVAAGLGIPGPPTAREIVGYMMGRLLDFAPGTRYAYSNFGYSVLGRVIEDLTGQDYEAFVRDRLLLPLGLDGMRIGGSSLDGRRDGEVRYYPASPLLPAPYDALDLGAMDAHGGWTGSAIDLARFAAALDPAITAAMGSPTPWEELPMGPYYGMGWVIEPQFGWWHEGALPGSASLLVRADGGLAWAALFNTLPESAAFAEELRAALRQAAEGVAEWD